MPTSPSASKKILLRGAGKCNLLHLRLLAEEIATIREAVISGDDVEFVLFDEKSRELLQSIGHLFCNRSVYFFEGATFPHSHPSPPAPSRKVLASNVPLDMHVDLVRMKLAEVVPIVSVRRLQNGNRRDSVHRRVGRVEVQFFTRQHAATFMKTTVFLNRRRLRCKYAPSEIISSPIAQSVSPIESPPSPTSSSAPVAGVAPSTASTFSDPGDTSICTYISAPPSPFQ